MSARVERGTVHTVRSVGFCSTVHTIRSVGFCNPSELSSRDDENPSLNKIEKRTSLSSGGSLGQSQRDSALSPTAKARSALLRRPVGAVAPASLGMAEVSASCPDPGMKILSVGTDCSGMEAPIQALQNMQIPIDHVFSCDNCPKVVSTIKANHQPKQFFNDIKERNNEVAPYVDLYVAGFPCQSFSTAYRGIPLTLGVVARY